MAILFNGDSRDRDKDSTMFASYVQSAGIADLVSLKNKQCISGGEYVAPDARVLFLVQMSFIHLQPGSGLLDSGWMGI